MNTLAGWGFTTPQAFAAHFELPPEAIKRSVRQRGGRHVSAAELEAYAASLDCAPTIMDVRRHFRCSRAAAYRYLAAMPKVGRGEA
jgi:hypothetical protein